MAVTFVEKNVEKQMNNCICRAMLCMRGICLSVSVSVHHVRGFNRNKHILASVSHTVIVFPYQTSWQYSDGNPFTGVGRNREYEPASDSITCCERQVQYTRRLRWTAASWWY